MSRILARLDELYAIGQHRAGYSPEEDAAHELASRWLREAGLEVTSDEAGNLFGRRGEARVWTGSHLDSVPTAGRFDGALGAITRPPRLGEHTAEVLREAGLPPAEIAAMLRSGAAAQWKPPPGWPAPMNERGEETA